MRSGRPLLMSDVLKSSVALVAEKLGRATLTAHEKIDEAIVVDIGPRPGLGCARVRGQATLASYIGKSSVAIVFQERHALGKFPSASQHQNVQHPSLL